MKMIKNVLFLAFTLSVFASCSNAPKGEKAATTEAAPVAEVEQAKSLSVNTGSSLIKWSGSKIGGTHTGTLAIKNGTVQLKDGKVAGGNFVIDMSSMKCTDLPEDKGKDLVGHLSSPDFFDVAKYPTSTFTITKVTGLSGDDAANSLVYGNLNMMGETKQISFKANVKAGANGVTVSTPDFTIDRTDFGIQYGSTKLADVVKDKAINDNVGLSIQLAAS